jgi:hypothetical protein
MSSGAIRKRAEKKFKRRQYANMDSDFLQMDQLKFRPDVDHDLNTPDLA